MDSLFAIKTFLEYLIISIVGFKPAIPGRAHITISFLSLKLDISNLLSIFVFVFLNFFLFFENFTIIYYKIFWFIFCYLFTNRCKIFICKKKIYFKSILFSINNSKIDLPTDPVEPNIEIESFFIYKININVVKPTGKPNKIPSTLSKTPP